MPPYPVPPYPVPPYPMPTGPLPPYPVSPYPMSTGPVTSGTVTPGPTPYPTPYPTSYTTPYPTSYTTPYPTPYTTPYSTPGPTPYSTPGPSTSNAMPSPTQSPSPGTSPSPTTFQPELSTSNPSPGPSLGPTSGSSPGQSPSPSLAPLPPCVTPNPVPGPIPDIANCGMHHRIHSINEKNSKFNKSVIILFSLASMPTFMQNADRIVGGEAAPSMIPWQVAMLSGSIQFCGGTILDSCTILTAAHCGINTGHTIRAGSLNKQSGGQVRTLELNLYFISKIYNSEA